jgi:hypothetical protein
MILECAHAAMLGVKVITLWEQHIRMLVFTLNQPMGNALVSDRNQYPKYQLRYMGTKKVAGYQEAMNDCQLKI